MRAPPAPRRSRSRLAALCVLRLRHLIGGHRFKKRWYLHKLHKIQRKGLVCVSPTSGVRAEDMMNIPSSLQPRKAKQRPLLIAAFPRGCSRSPRVRVLQRNRLSKLMISKRKYKLKFFDVKDLQKHEGCDSVTHKCAQTVGSIKKVTSHNADVRVIFHEANVIKCSNIGISSETSQNSPELFEFAPNQSIRIRDYPSLRRRPSTLPEREQNVEIASQSMSDLAISKAENDGPFSGNLSPQLQSPASSGDISPRIIKITEFADSPIISYSRLVYPSCRQRSNHVSTRSHISKRKREVKITHRS